MWSSSRTSTVCQQPSPPSQGSSAARLLPDEAPRPWAGNPWPDTRASGLQRSGIGSDLWSDWPRPWTVVRGRVRTLRLTQATGSSGRYQVEVALEGHGARRATTAEVAFALSLRDQERLRWYFEDYPQYPLDPAPEIAARIEQQLPRRKLDTGLAGGRLPRSGLVRISSYFCTL
jgi:hypothetical protein